MSVGRLLLTLCAALSLAPAWAAETGFMLREAELKSKPYLDAAAVAKLPERAQVEVVSRQGPWMQVKYKSKQGYVRMLQVRLTLSDTALARAPSAPPAASARVRPYSEPTVTTGVRGFDEQDLLDAEPAPEQYKEMVSYAATAQQAQQFAQQGQLAARAIPYYDDAGKPIKGGK
jgi:hypothetical protein